jgi:hypothetical protein
MTARCANPFCNQPFLYFRSGRIYLIDTPGSNTSTSSGPKKSPEYFWLCGDCCRTMKVVLDRSGSVTIESYTTCEAVA